MKRVLGLCCIVALALSTPAFTEAKPAKKAKAAKKEKAPPPPKLSEQTKRAIGELAGKFKWGMSPDEVINVIVADIKASYQDRLKKVSGNPLEQDRLRDEMNGDINKVRESLIKFTGQKSSWDISIVDQEFAHKNNEAMLVYWEANQRRFFFFENEKLWKQFIALNSDLFEGKSFEDFAGMIQQRYGEPVKIMITDSRGKETLEHLEWPAAGDYFLKAVDQVGMYGSYCLVLSQKSVLDGIDKRREENNPGHKRQTGADQVFKSKPESGPADGNTDVIDQITGRQNAKPKVEVDREGVVKPSSETDKPDEPVADSDKKPAKKAKKKAKKK